MNPAAPHGGVRTEARDGMTFAVIELPPDPRLRPLTQRQAGRLVAEARLSAGRNRSRPKRFRRMTR
jgi:hypothetical protein